MGHINANSAKIIFKIAGSGNFIQAQSALMRFLPSHGPRPESAGGADRRGIMFKKNGLSEGFDALKVSSSPRHWNAIPLFDYESFSSDFEGTLYFVLGQGLGDHVNGFRVFKEVKDKFYKAKYILYADSRWEGLVLRLEGVTIRWFPKASDVLNSEGTNNPYDFAHATIRKEIKVSRVPSYLAYAHFPLPDRHARRETTLQATARAINLELKEKTRPYLPVRSSDKEWATGFLSANGLKRGEFAVVAPFSWPNKRWTKEKFSELIDGLHQKLNLRTVVIAYPEMGTFSNDGVVCGYDLNLGQITGILSLAGLYVGLDSGLSHIAAFFDLPMVTIFIEKRTIPFEVRPLSPQSLNIVESFFYPVTVPSLETVLQSAILIFQKGSKSIPECPVCNGPMHYIASFRENRVESLCSCGFLKQWEVGDGSDPVMVQDSVQGSDSSYLDLSGRLDSIESVHYWSDEIERLRFLSISFRLDKNSFPTPPSDSSTLFLNEKIDFSLDAFWSWMRQKGYRLDQINNHSKMSELTFRKNIDSEQRPRRFFRIRWGSCFLVLTEDLYFSWYSFERWGNPDILVGIVKSQSEFGMWNFEMIHCAWIALRAKFSLRSFRWFIKSLIFAFLYNAMKWKRS